MPDEIINDGPRPVDQQAIVNKWVIRDFAAAIKNEDFGDLEDFGDFYDGRVKAKVEEKPKLDSDIDNYLMDIFNNSNKSILHIVPCKVKVLIGKRGELCFTEKEKTYMLDILKGNKTINLYITIINGVIRRIKTTKKNTIIPIKFYKVKPTDLVTVKLKSYEESAAVFGYTSIKKKMFNEGGEVQIEAIHNGYLCKKDGQKRDCVELLCKTNGKKLKFLLSDLDIQVKYNFETFVKSFNEKKALKAPIKGDKLLILKNNNGLYKKEVTYITTISTETSSIYLKVKDENSKIHYLNNITTKFKIK